jgi:hypothetical protein
VDVSEPTVTVQRGDRQNSWIGDAAHDWKRRGERLGRASFRQ